MKLSLEIIEKYNLPKTITRPDWDDVQNNYTLPNGIELSTLTVCCNEPCEIDMLEGFDGLICIDTEEELQELIKLTYQEVLIKIKSENDDFKIEDYE